MIVDGWAHAQAALRLIAADESIYAAFDGLGLGFDHDDVLDYLRGAPCFTELTERQQGRVAGLVMGFALTVAEAARGTRDRRQEPRQSHCVCAAGPGTNPACQVHL